MCFKIGNELKHSDYKRLTIFLKNSENISIKIFPGVELDFVSINPITVAVEGFGYRIDAEAVLKQPIGFEVCDGLKLDDDMNASIMVNRRNVKLSKIVAEQVDLERDLNMILKIMERIVNHVCIRFGGLIEKIFTLNSESLDRQLSIMLEREELQKRAEVARPFGTVHAKGSRDAKERAGGLIPLYKERDKTYLYDAKRVYFLLPHDFVAKLLRCDDTTMVREEEFDKRGKEVLRDMVYKKRLRKHETMGGIVCYYSLDGKTRRYLIKHLERKTSRL